MKRLDSELIEKARNSIDMKNLKHLIKDNNYKIAKVAINVGISDTTLYEYLSENTTPSLPVLINLADFFKCNIDYLVGRTSDPTLYKDFKTDEISEFIKMITDLTYDQKIFLRALLKEIIKEKEKIKN